MSHSAMLECNIGTVSLSGRHTLIVSRN